jgi:hypothetical protein
MTRHVSADTLARYREGGVSRRKAARISAHLSGCADCTGVNSDLAAVSSVLAGVRLPVMPDHLAARLQGALATEAAARADRSPAQAAGARGSDAVAADAMTAGTTVGAEAPARIPGRPDLPERARRSRRPPLSSPLVLRSQAAAGAVVILAGGGYLLASGSGSPISSTGRPAGGGGPLRGTARSGAVTPAFNLPYTQNGIAHTVSAIHSNINFAPATLARQVRRDVASGGTASLGTKVAHGTAVPSATTSRRMIAGVSVLALEGCVSLVASGRDVVLVDVARYEGDPATVIVTKQAHAAQTLFVTIVGLACSASHSDVITSVTIPAS